MVGTLALVEFLTESVNRRLGNWQAQFILPVWFQKTIGAWQSYAGGGHWRNPGAGNRDYWFFGWQAQNQITKQLSLGGELFYSSASSVTMPVRTGFNLGAVYDLDEGHHLMCSLGKDFRGSNVTPAYVACQWPSGLGRPKSQKKLSPLKP
jgi:hypothetical protein